MTHILRIDCADEMGLIAKITQILHKEHCNIISNDEFVGTQKQRFFMRTEFSGTINKGALKKDLQNSLPKDAVIELTDNSTKKIIVFASKESHCLAELLMNVEYGHLNVEIQAVISNHEDLESLVSRFDLPFCYVPTKDVSREEHEQAILKILEDLSFDYIILAKYMRILTEDFVHKHLNKIINIHHSFLPAFKGANPYQQAFDRGVKTIGATAHFVNEQLDEGPIIAQKTLPVSHSDTVDILKAYGRDIEKITLLRAVDLVIQGRVFIWGNKTIVWG